MFSFFGPARALSRRVPLVPALLVLSASSLESPVLVSRV